MKLLIDIKDSKAAFVLELLIYLPFIKVKRITDADYRDSKLAELLKEGLKSETLSAEETRKEFKKRGVNY